MQEGVEYQVGIYAIKLIEILPTDPFLISAANSNRLRLTNKRNRCGNAYSTIITVV